MSAARCPRRPALKTPHRSWPCSRATWALSPPSSRSPPREQRLGQPRSRLPGEIAGLAAEFQTLPDLFLPVGLSTDGDDEVAELLGSYLSADGEVTQLRGVLAEDPYTNEGIEAIPGLRRALAEEEAGYGAEASILTGGLTAAYADIQQTIGEDFWRGAATTVAGVLVVLIVLLRAVVAPIYLVATVLLSWLARMGRGALVFPGV